MAIMACNVRKFRQQGEEVHASLSVFYLTDSHMSHKDRFGLGTLSDGGRESRPIVGRGRRK